MKQLRMSAPHWPAAVEEGAGPGLRRCGVPRDSTY